MIGGWKQPNAGGAQGGEGTTATPPSSPRRVNEPVGRVFIKPFGVRIRHIAVGKLVVGQGTTTACGKKIGKFNLARESDKTELCAECRKAGS